MADIFQEFESTDQLTDGEDLLFTFGNSDFHQSERKEEEEVEENKKEKTDNKSIDGKECSNSTFIAIGIDSETSDTNNQSANPSLEELANSDFIHNRQLAAKKLLECLHEANSEAELESVVAVLCKLSEDEDDIVISELAEHMPSIALYCKEHFPGVDTVIRQELVPYIVKLLSDNQIQMRKAGHSSLLDLLKYNLIENFQLSGWICPLISQLALTESNIEELRVEDVSVMCKMMPLVGREITMEFFLDPFVSLCCDSSFIIRKVCASSFGSLGKMIGTEVIESKLLSPFMNLCKDTMWAVRKTCADVFVEFAKAATFDTRKMVLVKEFVILLNDDSHYVKNAAYQSLGAFIATFADLSRTNVRYENGSWLKNNEASSEQFKCLLNEDTEAQIMSKTEGNCDLSCKNLDNVKCSLPSVNECLNEQDRYKLNANSVDINSSNCAAITDIYEKLREEVQKKKSKMRNENYFNDFQFWRMPLPEVELDIDVEKAISIHVRTPDHSEDSSELCSTEVIVPNVICTTTKILNRNHSSTDWKIFKSCAQNYELSTEVQTLSSNMNSIYGGEKLLDGTENIVEIAEKQLMWHKEEKELLQKPVRFAKSPLKQQDVVPFILLQKFFSVIPKPFQSIDQTEEEKVLHCAFSFPAVVYTLGQENWHCIKDMYNTLARDMKWTVRRTIASSLHELAVILEHDIVVNDLLPIFLEFWKDIDEVRIKIILHLPEFLNHLEPRERRQFLPVMEELLKTDNENNWRYRNAIAEQLRPSVELFCAVDVHRCFLPVTLVLMRDKVSDVRKAAVELMAVIIKHLLQDEVTASHVKSLFTDFDLQYRHSHKWLYRQEYVFLCQQLAVHRAVPLDMYMDEIIPNLFSLTWDSVPNVRLAVARCIAFTFLPLEYLPSIQKSHYQLLLQVMCSLQSDIDKDVRCFAHLSSEAFSVLPQRKLSPV